MSPDELKAAYRNVLNPAFSGPGAILADIFAFCDLFSLPDYDEYGRNGRLNSQRCEGRREVALYILSQLGDNPFQVLGQMSQAYAQLQPEDVNDRSNADAADDGGPASG